jgi:hypothetical protein
MVVAEINRRDGAMTKPKDPKEELAKLAKLTAKDYNLPVAEVARIFMKYDIAQKGPKVEKAVSDALAECAQLRYKLTMGALKKNRLI